MFKSLSIAALLAVMTTTAASAQWQNAATGNSGGAFNNAPVSAAQAYGSPMQSLPTQKQNPLGIMTSGLGGSGAATGAPMTVGGFNTGFAPANMALQTQYGNNALGMNLNPANMMLPKTTLDSFVAQSGYNDLIYGDEGTSSEPPYFSFTPDHYIINGIHSGGLTTGHPSDAPSAWGYPQ